MTGSSYWPAWSAAAHLDTDTRWRAKRGVYARWLSLTTEQDVGRQRVRLRREGITFYDRRGEPIDQVEWVGLIGDMEYKRVGSTLVHNRYRVSTVWLGLDHSHGFSVLPLIFETCIFDLHDMIEVSVIGHHVLPNSNVVARYPTFDAAKRGHRKTVKLLREGVVRTDITI